MRERNSTWEPCKTLPIPGQHVKRTVNWVMPAVSTFGIQPCIERYRMGLCAMIRPFPASLLLLTSISFGVLLQIGRPRATESGMIHLTTLNHTDHTISLDLDTLASSQLIASHVDRLDSSNKSVWVSVVDITRTALPIESNAGSGLSCLKDYKEIMSDLWTTTLDKNSAGMQNITWLADIVGDSYARGQFTTLARVIQGDRGNATIAIPTYKKPRHTDRAVCCPRSKAKACILRLESMGNNQTLHEQVTRLASEYNREPVICVSFRWSEFTADRHTFQHLVQHEKSPIFPRAVLFNPGLHCTHGSTHFNITCSETSRQALDRLMTKLHVSRGIRFIVETAPILYSSEKYDRRGSTTELFN